MSNPLKNRLGTLSVCLMTVLMAAPGAQATDLDLSQVPLFLSPTVAPLNLLVVGRDHKLYYEAYNDASDLDADGVIDVGYRGYVLKSPAPTDPKESLYKIDYYGYFDSYKCYTYASALFSPTRETNNKKCGGAGEWSGDFLNYVTTARIDALRKVLYGGKRVVDTAAATVLERTHVPMDAHSWAKEYKGPGVSEDDYDIRDYSPYSAPTGGKRHLFANVTINVSDSQWYDNNRAPLLRILTNVTYRKWEWVSKESPDAGTIVSPPSGNVNVTPLDLEVRVAACVSAALIGKEPCQRYTSGNFKPIGLLHEFGENDSMKFGLLTGSYTANKSGGVLRKNMGSFTDEVNTTTDGTLKSTVGIIRTLDNLRAAAYTRYTSNGGTSYDCGLPAMARGAPTDGSCRMWGNPVAEMMYEGLRYFGGMAPTSAFTAIYGSSNTDVETRLNLPRPNWSDPYSSAPVCAKPFQTVMSDINNSYDSDQLPGSVFPLEVGSNAISAPLAGLDVAALADKITANEPGVTGLHFIGQSGTGAGSYDGAPTPKTVTSLSSIRGLAPEEPTKQGGYYAASVAYHGLSNPVRTGSDKTVQTFAVALASPLPRIEIPVGSGTITLVPFAKSVKYGTEINRAQGSFQPTNQIVDFYIESLAADRKSGTFQVNFEDVEAGNDHDMDAITRYSYQVNADNTVTVALSSDYQAGGIIHHIGYVISGTDYDGVYLDVQDCNKSGGTYSCNSDDPDYFLDTPPGKRPGEAPFDNAVLPGSSTRTFAPSANRAATLLKDPLWYAAKWGGFKDTNSNGLPDLQPEWDTDSSTSPGYNTPDNYFLVTNALTLSKQLRSAFDEITKRNASATAASVNSGAISTDTNIYQASFDTSAWTGNLKALSVDTTTGVVSTTQVWDAASALPSPTSRQIITVNTDGTAVPFQWANLDTARKAQLANDSTMLDYLRGNPSKENNPWRVRATKLGDIISSSPLYVGAPRMRYDDSLEAKPYSSFVLSNASRRRIVYAGANDGMLHAFDAGFPAIGATPAVVGSGREVFAFIPKTVFPNLSELPKSTYTHKYFVDGPANSGDVFYDGDWHTVLVGGLNRGGQGIYALDITNPSVLNSAEGAPESVFKWEFNDQNDRDLGYTYSQPAIVRLHNGKWAAVFGNGYNNTAPDGTASLTGNAVLYVVDIDTGAKISTFDTGIGTTADPTGNGRPNGMATPVMVDTDGDRVVDQAYVGDLFGNMWKIDLRSTNPNSWDFAFRDGGGNPQPFFTARDDSSNAQPITVRPEVARGRYGAGVMVLFGTGKYLETDDKLATPTRVQSFYGLLDKNTFTPTDRITSRTALVEQTIDSETTISGRGYRTTSNHPLTGTGWYLDLLSPSGYDGERSVSDPTVRDGRVFFSTVAPMSSACSSGGKSWIMFLDLLSGGRLPEAQVDTTGDGKIDNSDTSTSGFSSDAMQTRVELLMCVDGPCTDDRLLSSGSDGELMQENIRKNSRIQGRQSWRKIR